MSVNDAGRQDSATAGVGLRPAVEGVVNGPTSYPFVDHPAVDPAVVLSPHTHQQMSEPNRNRRPLIGQGTMNATDVLPPAMANFRALPPQNFVTHAPMGRPIVKGIFFSRYSIKVF